VCDRLTDKVKPAMQNSEASTNPRKPMQRNQSLQKTMVSMRCDDTAGRTGLRNGEQMQCVNDGGI
jgi:hypothetical protein